MPFNGAQRVKHNRPLSSLGFLHPCYSTQEEQAVRLDKKAFVSMYD